MKAIYDGELCKITLEKEEFLRLSGQIGDTEIQQWFYQMLQDAYDNQGKEI